MSKPGKKPSDPKPVPKGRPKRSGPGDLPAAPQHDPGLQAVLDILRAKAGQDFSCYKPSTVARRIERRMALSKVATAAEYARFLEENPEEAALLQKDLLIGVTEFFRQPQAWEVLRDDVIAPLVERTPAGFGDPDLGPGLLDGTRALQPGDPAGRADRGLRQRGRLPDLRHGQRPGRAGGGPFGELFTRRDRRRHLPGAAEEISSSAGMAAARSPKRSAERSFSRRRT